MGEVIYMREQDAAMALAEHGEKCEACSPSQLQIGCAEGSRLWTQYIAAMRRSKKRRQEAKHGNA